MKKRFLSKSFLIAFSLGLGLFSTAKSFSAELVPGHYFGGGSCFCTNPDATCYCLV